MARTRIQTGEEEEKKKLNLFLFSPFNLLLVLPIDRI
jgi:hypothetical protein